MPASCFLGVDPGLSGAIAFFFPDAQDHVASEDLPVANGFVDAANLVLRIQQMAPDVALIERVSSMPGQGVASTFKFGLSCGTIIGVVAALKVPVHFCSPTKWKKYFCLGKDKEESRALAIQLFPACAAQFARKKDHNRAEAALLALYASRTIQHQSKSLIQQL